MLDRRSFIVGITTAIAGCANGGSGRDGTTPSGTNGPSATSPRETTRDSQTERHTTSPETGSNPPTGGAVTWVFQMNGAIARQPVASNGTVYAAGGKNNRTDSPGNISEPASSQNVYALTLSGEKRWRHETSAAVLSLAPTRGGLYSIVGWNMGDAGRHQRVVRIEDGQQRWTTDPLDTTQLNLLGTHDGAAFVCTATDVRELSGRSFFALEPDGTERFRVESGQLSTATIHGNSLYAVVGGGRRTVARDLSTGTRRWKHSGAPLSSEGWVFDDTIYLRPDSPQSTGDEPLVAIDITDGSDRWQYRPADGSFVPTGITEEDGSIYLTTFDGQVVSLGTKNRREQWRYSVPTEIRASPLVLDGTVYVPEFGGTVHAIDATSGERQWTHSIAGTLRWLRSTTENIVAWSTNDDGIGVHALSLGGDELWAFESDGPATPPTVTSDGVFIGTESGYVARLGE